MKKSLGCSMSLVRSAGALLSLLALIIAAFASDSGTQDPAGARLSALIIWMPVVFLVCLVASTVLSGMQRGALALAVCALPILYFLAAIAMSG